MMAFLHHVVNGRGQIEREYAISSHHMDLCLFYGDTRIGMELKVWRDGKPDLLAQGLQQLDHYLGALGLDSGWLVLFDKCSGLPEISERTTIEDAKTPTGRTVRVIRA